MVFVAVFFDLLQAILAALIIGGFLNWFVNLIAWLTFFLWFKLNGVSIGDSGRKWLVQGGTWMIEMLPFINGLTPGWVVFTISIIMISRYDDKQRTSNA